MIYWVRLIDQVSDREGGINGMSRFRAANGPSAIVPLVRGYGGRGTGPDRTPRTPRPASAVRSCVWS